MPGILTRLFNQPIIGFEMLIATFLANFLALATPIFVMQVLGRYVAYGVDSTLWTLAIGAFIAIFLEYAFRQIRMYLAINACSPIDNKINCTIFNSALRTRADLFDLFSPGERREALTGLDTIRTAYAAPNLCAIMDVPFAIIFLGAVFLLHTSLGIIALGFILIILIAQFVIFLSLRNPQQKLSSETARRSELVTALLREAYSIRAFNGAKHLFDKYELILKKLNKWQNIITRSQGKLQNLALIVPAAMSVSLIGIGASYVVTGDLQISALIGANILAARAFGPIIRLGPLTQILSKAQQNQVICNNLLQIKHERENGTVIRNITGEIKFCDLAFTYPQDTGPLFERLDLILEPGSVLAIVGPNGSGKTTFVRMLMGLHQPSRGKILVDGITLEQLVPEWWRNQVSYIPQEPYFLPGTIAENLGFFNNAPIPPEINDVIRRAGLETFIDQTKDGMQTYLQAGGLTLSLGIRRRLALARALILNGKFLIIDEPTEGLDSFGIKTFYDAMNSFSNANATVIVCSHDPNIIKGANWIIDLGQKPNPKVSKLTRRPVGGA